MNEQAGWRIRPWKVADDEAISGLFSDLMSGPNPVVSALPADLDDIRANYHQQGGEFWSAFQGDRLVGIVGGLDLGGDVVTLRNLFTAADLRGSGLAAALLQELIEWAESFGLHTVISAASDHMTGLVGFYERHGFAEVTADDLPADFPRLAHHDRFFRRKLRASPENPNTVHFEKIPWNDVAPGHREKQAIRGGTVARMVELDGHYDSTTPVTGGVGGIVLEGRVTFVFDQHESVCADGQGFVIPDGQEYRMRLSSGRVRLFVI